jgi:type IV secretory pathway VirJ component
LPVIEVPAQQQSGDTLAVLISGDGGWAGIDKAVAGVLAENGIPVVGVDSLRYFWKERTPESTAGDIDQILRHYLAAWDKQNVVLIGYSQGADVLPFIVNRLPAHMRSRVRLTALLSLGVRATFEFHLSNWLSGNDEDETLPIAPELQRMSGMRALCVYGDGADNSVCDEAASSTLRAVNIPGGHHFGGDYDRVAALILEELR